MSDTPWFAQPDPFLFSMHAAAESVAGRLEDAAVASPGPLEDPVSDRGVEGAPWADGQDDLDVVAEGFEEPRRLD